MALQDTTKALWTRLNNGSNTNFAYLLGLLGFGRVMRQQVAQWQFTKVPALSGYQLATLHEITLPENAKAAVIHRVVARVGGVTGEFTGVGYGVAPATTQFAVAPNGDVVILAADAVTEADVYYTPIGQEVVEFTTQAPVAGVFTIPSSLGGRKVISLIEAEVLAGAVTGKCKVLVPAAGLPATTQARLNIAKTQVQFNTATDVPTSVRVKLGIAPLVNYATTLDGVSPV